jgi:hypothetical protein
LAFRLWPSAKDLGAEMERLCSSGKDAHFPAWRCF